MLLSWTSVNFSAATHGHGHIIEWMHANRPRHLTVAALCGAVIGGHVNMARWLVAHRSFNGAVLFNMCDRYVHEVKSVSTPMVQWLLSEYKWCSTAMDRKDFGCISALWESGRCEAALEL